MIRFRKTRHASVVELVALLEEAEGLVVGLEEEAQLRDILEGYADWEVGLGELEMRTTAEGVTYDI